MHSMTGFGRGEAHTEDLSATVEMAAVNRKQADIQITLPKHLAELEGPLRKLVQAQISRGRINVTVTIAKLDNVAADIVVDEAKAQAVENAFRQLSGSLGRTIQPSAADFLNVPDLLVHNNLPLSPKTASPVIKQALTEALDKLIASRVTEGLALKQDFLQRLTTLSDIVANLETLAPTVSASYHERLTTRLQDIGLDIDLNDDRVLREVALFAERSDISEELTRLHAHLKNFHDTMARPEACGRPLDFLCQEINREFNTIGSKAHSSDITQNIVAAKTELEKIREQVQNVE